MCVCRQSLVPCLSCPVLSSCRLAPRSVRLMPISSSVAMPTLRRTDGRTDRQLISRPGLGLGRQRWHVCADVSTSTSSSSSFYWNQQPAAKHWLRPSTWPADPFHTELDRRRSMLQASTALRGRRRFRGRDLQRPITDVWCLNIFANTYIQNQPISACFGVRFYYNVNRHYTHRNEQ